jgi:hypothetical protein
VPYTLPVAGQTITAALWAELASYAVPITAYKAGDTNRASTITSTADPDLVIVLPANRTYEVEITMYVTSAANAAGDFRFALGWTNTATVTLGGHGIHISVASGSSADLEALGIAADTTTPTSDIGIGASTTRTTVKGWATVVTGGSNVTLSLLWAQASSNANNTTLLTGSSIVARRANV